MKIALLSLFTILSMVLYFQKTEKLQVKFKNNTEVDFVKLTANIRGKVYTFSNLKAGKTTKWIIVESSYYYCYAKAITSENDTLICQPEDFVGEPLVSKGKLTLLLQRFPKHPKEKYIMMDHQYQ